MSEQAQTNYPTVTTAATTNDDVQNASTRPMPSETNPAQLCNENIASPETRPQDPQEPLPSRSMTWSIQPHDTTRAQLASLLDIDQDICPRLCEYFPHYKLYFANQSQEQLRSFVKSIVINFNKKIIPTQGDQIQHQYPPRSQMLYICGDLLPQFKPDLNKMTDEQLKEMFLDCMEELKKLPAQDKPAYNYLEMHPFQVKLNTQEYLSIMPSFEQFIKELKEKTPQQWKRIENIDQDKVRFYYEEAKQKIGILERKFAKENDSSDDEDEVMRPEQPEQPPTIGSQNNPTVLDDSEPEKDKKPEEDRQKLAEKEEQVPLQNKETQNVQSETPKSLNEQKDTVPEQKAKSVTEQAPKSVQEQKQKSVHAQKEKSVSEKGVSQSKQKIVPEGNQKCASQGKEEGLQGQQPEKVDKEKAMSVSSHGKQKTPKKPIQREIIDLESPKKPEVQNVQSTSKVTLAIPLPASEQPKPQKTVYVQSVTKIQKTVYDLDQVIPNHDNPEPNLKRSPEEMMKTNAEPVQSKKPKFNMPELRASLIKKMPNLKNHIMKLNDEQLQDLLQQSMNSAKNTNNAANQLAKDNNKVVTRSGASKTNGKGDHQKPLFQSKGKNHSTEVMEYNNNNEDKTKKSRTVIVMHTEQYNEDEFVKMRRTETGQVKRCECKCCKNHKESMPEAVKALIKAFSAAEYAQASH